MKLEEFAAKRVDSRKRCAVCDLPAAVLKEVNAGLAAGLTFTVVGDWLEAEGFAGRRTAVSRHWKQGHAGA